MIGDALGATGLRWHYDLVERRRDFGRLITGDTVRSPAGVRSGGDLSTGPRAVNEVAALVESIALSQAARPLGDADEEYGATLIPRFRWDFRDLFGNPIQIVAFRAVANAPEPAADT